MFRLYSGLEFRDREGEVQRESIRGEIAFEKDDVVVNRAR